MDMLLDVILPYPPMATTWEPHGDPMVPMGTSPQGPMTPVKCGAPRDARRTGPPQHTLEALITW